MATSQFPTLCEAPLDPKDERHFVIDLALALEPGEAIEDDFTLAVRPESGLLGLTIYDAPTHPDPLLIEDGQAVQLWLGVDSDYHDDPAFDGAGTFCPFEIFSETSDEQKINRTFSVQVCQL